MRTVGLRPMTAHFRSVILIGPPAFAASGGFIAVALALPPNIVAPAIPERDPTNPLRVQFAISFISQERRSSTSGAGFFTLPRSHLHHSTFGQNGWLAVGVAKREYYQ